MRDTIPWLKQTFDPKAKPGVAIYGFNTTKPPFDNPLVRQAFAAAVDREEVAAIATRYHWQNAQPATTFMPSQVLGRDLYNQVGMPFDPNLAKELLTQAGYSNPASFPKTILYISLASSEFPGATLRIAEAIVKMWQEHLGINVDVKSIGNVSDLTSYLRRNSKGYEIYFMGFYMPTEEELDPSFLELFHSSGYAYQGYNYAHFSSPQFDSMLDDARNEINPTTRQILYIDAERILCETEVAIIPLFHYTVLQDSDALIHPNTSSYDPLVIEIRADIDGLSRLILRGNTAQWYHLKFAAPGREGATNPTAINGVDWYPIWRDIPDSTNRDCNCRSDIFTGVAPALPARPMEVELEILNIVRRGDPNQPAGTVSIIQFPTPENNFTIIVEFDDTGPAASAFYHVRLKLTRK